MISDIDEIIESVRSTRDDSIVTLPVRDVDALLGHIEELQESEQTSNAHRWQLEDWLAYIADHTSDPEITYYCARAIDGDSLDVLEGRKPSEDETTEATE